MVNEHLRRNCAAGDNSNLCNVAVWLPNAALAPNVNFGNLFYCYYYNSFQVATITFCFVIHRFSHLYHNCLGMPLSFRHSNKPIFHHRKPISFKTLSVSSLWAPTFVGKHLSLACWVTGFSRLIIGHFIIYSFLLYCISRITISFTPFRFC